MDDVRTVTVERCGYSRLPWRLIDSATRNEVRFEHEQFDHPECGPMRVPVPGYQTKSSAVEALGRLAGRILEREAADG